MNLTKEEFNILYYMKTKNGKTSYEANRDIKNIKKHLNMLKIKLNKNKKLTTEEKNQKFKEAFHNICQMC